MSPTTFEEKDADRAKRWAVRLIDVQAGVDPSGQLFDPTPVDAPMPITEIVWDATDALPFPLCVSVPQPPDREISVVLGNIVLADHGQTVQDEALNEEGLPLPRRFRPAFEQAPLTQAFDLEAELGVDLTNNGDDDTGWRSASALVARDPHEAMPQVIRLVGTHGPSVSHWTPRRDLLASAGDATDYVVETESDGLARLRFGDNVHGRRPDPLTVFQASYRVGNGTAGNVGAEAIAHIVSNVNGVVDKVVNPMPASGGIEPEDIDAARRDAPEAFRTQQRRGDRGRLCGGRGATPRRAARRPPSDGPGWHTVPVTADRFGGAAIDPRFEARLRRHLERFRMAGYDLEVDGPRYVPLDGAAHCVEPDYFCSKSAGRARAELGADVLPDGRLAVFHPDSFSFGDAVYLGRLVAAAQTVEGVEAGWAQRFARLAAPDAASLDSGVMPIGRLEIAQLANDPNFRERGRLTLEAGGGK